MLELLKTALGLVGILAIIWFYCAVAEASTSHGAGTVFTAAWLAWGWPFLFLILIALLSGSWRLGLAVLLIGVAAFIGGWIGSLIARWRHNDSFGGAIIGAMAGLFVAGAPILHVMKNI